MPTKTFQIDTNSLKKIADNVPAIIALYDIKDGHYLYMNNAVTRILGYSSNDFMNGGLEFAIGLMHPKDLESTMQKNQMAVEAANARSDTKDEAIASFEYRMKHKNGEWHWLHTDGTVFQRAPDGSVHLILNVSLDVTERKTAEAYLKTSLQTLDEILSAA